MKNIKNINLPNLSGRAIAFTGLLFSSLLLANPAFAQSNGPGNALHAAYPSTANCITTSSYAGVTNTCGYPVLVVGSLQVATGWHSTSVSIYGNNSNCQFLSTNGVGNGSNLGPVTYTLSGPKTWQTLNTSSIYVWDWSPLIVRCSLESGGIIGSFTAI
ncbi:hypothetical protein [Methylomonas sp. AM2-LC]|uniref:hypothetical protein n=1 Tax=Methylomonas sp. AM2-LC TaxID=3153301 RepID=UPI00326444F9